MSKHATATPALTQARLRGLLNYDPDSGIFTWADRRYGVRQNLVAGTLKPSGYVRIGIDGRMYSAHRLAFLYMTGEFPCGDVDHINHDRSDNRWGNLRVASRAQNLGNASLSKRNKSGFKGVSWNKQSRKWQAHICVGGRSKFLGLFIDIEKAAAAYASAAREHFNEFAHAAVKT